jgi:hypothetical protein
MRRLLRSAMPLSSVRSSATSLTVMTPLQKGFIAMRN